MDKLKEIENKLQVINPSSKKKSRSKQRQKVKAILYNEITQNGVEAS